MYTCLQLPGVCDDMTEKNVDKIKIGDNIINIGGGAVPGIRVSPNSTSAQFRYPGTSRPGQGGNWGADGR